MISGSIKIYEDISRCIIVYTYYNVHIYIYIYIISYYIHVINPPSTLVTQLTEEFLIKATGRTP